MHCNKSYMNVVSLSLSLCFSAPPSLIKRHPEISRLSLSTDNCKLQKVK